MNSRSHDNALILMTRDPGREAFEKRFGRDAAEYRAMYRVIVGHVLDLARRAAAVAPFDLVIVSDAQDRANLERACEGVSDLPPLHLLAHRRQGFAGQFADALERTADAGYRKMAIIGNDCFDLEPSDLVRAFAALDEREIVIGPAADGGFYLLGLREYRPELLNGIPWRSGAVLERLLGNVAALELRSVLLTLRSDIDSRDDLQRWLAARRSGAAAILHRLLRRIRPLASPPRPWQPTRPTRFLLVSDAFQRPPPFPA